MSLIIMPKKVVMKIEILHQGDSHLSLEGFTNFINQYLSEGWDTWGALMLDCNGDLIQAFSKRIEVDA